MKAFARDGAVVGEVHGSVAVVRLRRPDVLNALTPEMVKGLREVVASFSADEAVTGLVLTGQGRAFCAGADIGFESRASEAEFADFIDALQELARLLRTSDLLIVAALNGIAVGGGAELALGCDARIVAPDSLMGFPEVNLGLTVTGGVTFTLPRLIGTSRALELLVSGRTIPADEALSLGLVDRIADDVLGESIRFAGIADRVPHGLLATIKSELYQGEDGTMEQALEVEKHAIMDAFRRPAAREGLQAFFDRPRATNTGRTDDA